MDTPRIEKEIHHQETRPVLLVLTGPTAAGKDTLMKELLKKNSSLTRLVTTNSRPKRQGEEEGVDYHFVSREQFEKLMAEDAFVEWVEYLGHYKGTQKKHLYEALSSGKDVVWRIDVKGVKNIKQKILAMQKDPQTPVQSVAFVFLTAPDLQTLQSRMEKRGTENEHVWHTSLNLAKWEMEQFDDSDYLVVNRDSKMDTAVEQVTAIVEAERRRILEKK